jgi:hypothetical protein
MQYLCTNLVLFVSFVHAFALLSGGDEGCRQHATLLEILHIAPSDVCVRIIVVQGQLHHARKSDETQLVPHSRL